MLGSLIFAYHASFETLFVYSSCWLVEIVSKPNLTITHSHEDVKDVLGDLAKLIRKAL